MFCHDTGSIQGQWFFFSFFGLFLYLFKNQKIYYNKNVLSKPLKVIVYIGIASKSAFKRFAHEDATCKTEAFFVYVISGEQSANGTKKSRNHAFLDAAKSVNRPKNRYTPFLHEGLQLIDLSFLSTY